MALSFAHYVLISNVLLVLLVGWLYFRCYALVRPPIGVVTVGDVLVMLVGVVLVPYLYLLLPDWVLASLLALVATGILYITLEPIIRRRWAIWLITLLVVAAELTLAWRDSMQSGRFLSLHNLILTMMAVGIANLWAQSGMKARDAALLGLLLAIYDFVFTVQLSLMGDLIERVAGLPFAPLVAWPIGSKGQWLGIGLGDLLLATVFPLVMHKAFSRTAGWVALSCGFGTIILLLLLPGLGVNFDLFPVMVVLGPLMAFQYAYWHRRLGRERTTSLYLEAEPRGRRHSFVRPNMSLNSHR